MQEVVIGPVVLADSGASEHAYFYYGVALFGNGVLLRDHGIKIGCHARNDGDRFNTLLLRCQVSYPATVILHPIRN